jgi:DnaJ-class molecular chaperone
MTPAERSRRNQPPVPRPHHEVLCAPCDGEGHTVYMYDDYGPACSRCDGFGVVPLRRAVASASRRRNRHGRAGRPRLTR